MNWAALLLLTASFGAAAVAPGREAIDSAMAELAKVTGFTIKHPVAFEPITRDQVNTFLRDRIQESVKPEELRAEELTLKKFGFVPQDFDLKKTTIDLLTEQTAAFYDFHRKKLYITDWAAASLQQAALVHELGHALADQNFPLERFSKKVENDSEQSLARQAVVEGQASWLMRAVLERDLARSGKEPEQAAQAEESFPVFDKAPLYFRETLMFPYDQGILFQQAVYERMGKDAFGYVFRHPPVSSQQLLHPESYFAGLIPARTEVPEVKGMKRLVEGPVGELDESILLRQYCSEAEAKDVSPHWRGGKYRLYEDKKGKRVAMVYRSAWTDPEWARKYFELYQRVLAGKWKSFQVEKKDETSVEGRGDDGYFRVALVGAEVTSWEGFAAPVGKD
jgi:Zn-dependent peptidase ImmA (M78 family)